MSHHELHVQGRRCCWFPAHRILLGLGVPRTMEPHNPCTCKVERGVLCTQDLPGIERCSKVESAGTSGFLQHLQWVCMRCLGGAGRKAQLWVCHCSTFQAHPSLVHPMKVAAVQPLVIFPYLRALSLVPWEHPHELKTAFTVEH